ncbi:uncharacterized protein PFL1_04531 [Pseudozyma flocculosa PF-1]|uniref:Uncharacterized protein n=1 Tax=Pseudozyma flocculosa PF-1 TaxID=1277687 RepID=A0A061HB10_9BASI|nr:uncharacterized protein PFL1_04531 [Pseudozyma flocculosa PF-1]EPQ27786.1 hypothetical protein PFL1_04531 [Pseudozyma flocculosa PF-1]
MSSTAPFSIPPRVAIADHQAGEARQGSEMAGPAQVGRQVDNLERAFATDFASPWPATVRPLPLQSVPEAEQIDDGEETPHCTFDPLDRFPRRPSLQPSSAHGEHLVRTRTESVYSHFEIGILSAFPSPPLSPPPSIAPGPHSCTSHDSPLLPLLSTREDDAPSATLHDTLDGREDGDARASLDLGWPSSFFCAGSSRRSSFYPADEHESTARSVQVVRRTPSTPAAAFINAVYSMQLAHAGLLTWLRSQDVTGTRDTATSSSAAAAQDDAPATSGEAASGIDLTPRAKSRILRQTASPAPSYHLPAPPPLPDPSVLFSLSIPTSSEETLGAGAGSPLDAAYSPAPSDSTFWSSTSHRSSIDSSAAAASKGEAATLLGDAPGSSATSTSTSSGCGEPTSDATHAERETLLQCLQAALPGAAPFHTGRRRRSRRHDPRLQSH